MEMENYIRFVVVIFAVGLFVVATYLYLSGATASATSAMGFVFLLVVVLTISNYKRIKGFGFEAEMWEEKQVQAAKLIDRLELLSKATTQQVALIAAKLGLWDNGLSNLELAEMVDVTRKILQSTGTSEAERKNILAPLYRRIVLNYINAARQLLENELKNARAVLDEARKTTAPDQMPKWQEQVGEVDKALKKERELNVVEMIENRTIQPFENITKESPALSGKAKLSMELADIATDMAFFEVNGSLRRSINWDYLWK
jgi:hypothetical protein